MDIRSKEFTAIVREIARRNQTDPDIVRNVIISQFECVRVSMKKCDPYNDYFPHIRLPYLFSFKVLQRRRNFFVKRAKKIIEDVYTEEGQAGD